MEAMGSLPLDAQSCFGEMQQVLHGNEIDEGISNVTTFTTGSLAITLDNSQRRSGPTVLEIHSQIHKIDPSRAHIRDKG